jgi:ribonuclease BN (tRNA processing enzyme)
MSIRVLGCSGSIAAGSRTTSFLLDDSVLIDAGTGVGDLSLDELAAIDHILVSHSHLDHILSIGLLADSVLRIRRARERPPIVVHALEQTLAALRTHIFNGVIWPDFTALPDRDWPVLRFAPFTVGEQLVLGRRSVEVLPARHTVPAVGFAVWASTIAGAGPAWVFTGDTGPNPPLWERLRSLQVRSLVIETAFRDDERDLAERSAHLHPTQLMHELAQLDGAADVYITHIKPGEVDAVMADIGCHQSPHRLQALAAGQCITLAGQA